MEKGWCVWITGLPGSGKSTVAHLLLEKLESQGISAQITSIDSLRKYATPEPTYSEAEREIVYGALTFNAIMLTENGVNVIIDATANRRIFRDKARHVISRFIEAYLKCPLEICAQREAHRRKTHLAPKDIYRKAKQGKSSTVPGIGVPYEESIEAEVRVDSSRHTAEECAQKILTAIHKLFLDKRGIRN